ncbi:MAG: hypothetical protein M3R30_06400 [Candidatus Eremiobacteraeota bacterium]|nr:hypothetical protein [Candidatus Eremiobacteraeota bacterium]
MRRLTALLALVAFAALPMVARATESLADRQATQAKVRATLDSYGQSDAGITFHQVEKNPFNFAGTLSNGLKNSDMLEAVVAVTNDDTINVIVYPHVDGKYVNIVKSKHAAALARKLLELNYRTFFFWGADDTDDVYASYKFTLESGYPEDSLRTALTSIPLLDQFVSEFRPYAF